MVVIPALMRALPTIMDSRTIMPARFFVPLEILGTIFRNFVITVQKKESVSRATRILLPKFLVNVVIIAALLSSLSISDPYLTVVYKTFASLQIVPYEVFKLILVVGVIAYPVVNFFGKAGEITQSLFESTQSRITKTPLLTGGMHYVHRLIRNVVTGIAVLLVSSFVTPSISVITGIDIILPVSSFVTLGIFVYLILDTFLVINRKMESGIIRLLLDRDIDMKREEPNKEP
jgi:hypothetical protein